MSKASDRIDGDDIVLGRWTLQIEDKIIASFRTEELAEDAPEADYARETHQQILIYGPDGEFR